ncbi:MAG: 50S ribosomal protein L35 [Coriobacteriia bacterium]|nr:50S ribosomal protein L35 [Coriobacteriia bacterium]MCL2746072.1 50S ribosomal protein L35 [Coriobacteriia bacterium]MCL2871053.1 50S ribosomal protein L35 [Coriobacteriia bacterium]
MPKQKTHKGTAKRIRVTSTGKLMRGKAFTSHMMVGKSPKRKRNFRQDGHVSEADSKMINKKLGLG